MNEQTLVIALVVLVILYCICNTSSDESFMRGPRHFPRFGPHHFPRIRPPIYAPMPVPIYTPVYTPGMPYLSAALSPNQNWTCLDGIDVPIRRDLDGNISCLAENGKDCVWGGCAEKLKQYALPENAARINPLVCGTAHAQYYGITGYDTQGHWCAVGDNLLARN